jgi:hypothetical protein
MRWQRSPQGYFHDLQLQGYFSPARAIRGRPKDQHLPVASALHLDVLRAGQRDLDHILTHRGPWDPTSAVVWCVWTSFATLAGIGIIRPVKMLPIILLEIFYKVLWLILVAYPLWSKGTLAGSPAEDITSSFLWVILPIVAVPWRYVFVTYIYEAKQVEKNATSLS